MGPSRLPMRFCRAKAGRPRRTCLGRRLRTGLVLAIASLSWLNAAAPAMAQTSVSGATDPLSPLEIAPSGPSEEKVFGRISQVPIFAITDLPSQKLVREVTVGDIALPTGCSPTEQYVLVIEERSRLDWGDTIGSAVVSLGRTLPESLGRVTFSVPPTILKANGNYRFLVGNRSGNCASVRMRSWAHNAPQVNGGDSATRCHPTEDSLPYVTDFRMWHSSGADATSCPSAAGTPEGFDPGMPPGWLMVRRSSGAGSYVYTLVNYPWNPPGPPDCPGPSLGAAKWGDPSPSNGGQAWVCQSRLFSAPGESVGDGWYWSHLASEPRDLFFRLDGSDGLRASDLFGASNPAAPNLKRSCAGDPVNCATGNFFETYNDFRVGGSGWV